MPNASVILCTAGYDRTVKFWEATSGKCYRTIQYNDSQVNALCISPDKQCLAVAGNPHVRIYDINKASSAPIQSLDEHKGNVTAVGFHRDRKWVYSASEDGTIKIWDTRVAGSQREYHSKAAINTVALHPNQGELTSGDEDGNIYVWDLSADKCLYELVPEGKTPVRSITIASDASLMMAANNRGMVYSWKIDSKKGFEPLQKIEAHNAYVLKCVLSSPDVKYLATTSSDKTVKIWNAEKNFALQSELAGHQRWVWDCAFNADSAYLVTGSSDTRARLWDVKTGKCIIEYKGHTKAVTSVALNDSSQ